MRLTATLILIPFLALAGCGPGGGGSASGKAETGPYAGLETAIKGWRADIVKAEPACQAKGGKGCEGFEVACKGERSLTPEETAKGVTAKVAVAMTWTGWDAARAEHQPESGAAEFAKVGQAWTRTEAKPVNLSTCADL